MKRSTLMALALLLALTSLSLSNTSTTNGLVPTVEASDPTSAQCGMWLNNCTQAGHAAYNSCVAAGGNGTSCALMAEDQVDACIQGLWDAGCSSFPHDCYVIDVRQPFAKACRT